MILRLILAGCCLVAVVATPQAIPPPQTEQVETGTVAWTQAHRDELGSTQPARSMLNYRIRLLPVSSFPQLPTPVAQQLAQRGCMIPQTYEAREPENVIQGSFEKKGSDDWAALCSVNRVTTLYVFFQSDIANPIALRHQPDSEWLGVEWSLDYGSAWGIASHPARLMRPKDSADHDGIDDAFVEKSTSIRYFENGRWTTRDASQ
ncbi:MAG TPA: hypothetical protein VG297_13515 [Bryobacteraceae bacterium]|nr:hypothetical protein [Bryobacteraceae bacterium]